jgi:hypothetical protein
MDTRAKTSTIHRTTAVMGKNTAENLGSAKFLISRTLRSLAWYASALKSHGYQGNFRAEN